MRRGRGYGVGYWRYEEGVGYRVEYMRFKEGGAGMGERGRENRAKEGGDGVEGEWVGGEVRGEGEGNNRSSGKDRRRV